MLRGNHLLGKPTSVSPQKLSCISHEFCPKSHTFPFYRFSQPLILNLFFEQLPPYWQNLGSTVLMKSFVASQQNQLRTWFAISAHTRWAPTAPVSDLAKALLLLRARTTSWWRPTSCFPVCFGHPRAQSPTQNFNYGNQWVSQPADLPPFFSFRLLEPILFYYTFPLLLHMCYACMAS